MDQVGTVEEQLSDEQVRKEIKRLYLEKGLVALYSRDGVELVAVKREHRTPVEPERVLQRSH